MKIKYLRIPLFLIAVAIVFSLYSNGYIYTDKKTDNYSIVAKAVTYIGNCGKNCKWTLDLGRGILLIEGNGKTFDYEDKNTPWYKYREGIDKIVVSEGVKTLGEHFFAGLSSVKTAQLPRSLKSIHNNAFYGCASLKKIEYAQKMKLSKIGDEAFAYCRKLENFPSSGSLTSIGSRAFYYCYNLKEVSLGYSVGEIGQEAFDYCLNLSKIRIVNFNCNIDESEGTIYKSAVIESFKTSSAKKYADKYSRSFKVIKDINYLNDMSAKLSYISTSYNGKSKKPIVSIKGLKAGRDFKVKYSDNVNLGIASVYIYAAGDTLGEKKLSFKINPPKVKGVRLTERKKDSLKIKWNSSQKAQKYEVFQLVSGKWKLCKTTENTSVQISGLESAKKYSFKVRAIYGEGKKKCSGKLSTVFSAYTKPSETAIENAAGAKGGRIKLSLKKVSGADGYELYMATSAKGKYELIETFDSKDKLSSAIEGLKKSKTYYFKARSFLENGEKLIYSDFCQPVSVKAK